jgi:Holliday junction resolvase RusA-like endonuclease
VSMRFTEEWLEDHLAKRAAAAAPADPVVRQPTLFEPRALMLTLPMPVSVNDAWHATPGGGKTLTAEHRAYRKTVGRIVRQTWKQPALYGRIEMHAILCFPDRRVADIDNRIKPLQDALTVAGVWRDDCQVDRLIVERYIVDTGKTSCEVRIREIAA